MPGSWSSLAQLREYSVVHKNESRPQEESVSCGKQKEVLEAMQNVMCSSGQAVHASNCRVRKKSSDHWTTLLFSKYRDETV